MSILNIKNKIKKQGIELCFFCADNFETITVKLYGVCCSLLLFRREVAGMTNEEYLKIIIQILNSRPDDRRLLIAVYTLITNM